jgi:hypothetical protein
MRIMNGAPWNAVHRSGRLVVGVVVFWTLTGTPGVSAQFGGVVDLSTTGMKSIDPDVATDPAGTSTIVWDTATGGGFVVQARRLTSAGQLGPIRDLSLPGTREALPRTVIDSSGQATVVWKRRIDVDTTIVQARRIGPDGVLGSILDLSPPAQEIDGPEVAVDLAGNAIVVWSASESGSSEEVKVQARRISAGGTPGPLLELFHGGPHPQSTVENRPGVAVDAAGTATVVWPTATDCCFGNVVVNARRIGPDESLGSVIEVMTFGRNPFGGANARIAVDPAGTATVLVRSDVFSGGSSYLLARVMTPDNVLGSTHDISFGSGCRGQGLGAAVREARRTTIVWDCFRSQADGTIDFSTHARQIDPDDQMGPVLDLLPNGASVGAWSGAARDGTGRVTAVWLATDANMSRVQGRQFLPDGRVGATLDIAAFSRSGPHGLRVAVDPTGLTTVVWSDDLPDGVSTIVQAAQGWVPVFADVTRGNIFWAWVEALFQAGITAGCAVDPLQYCPDALVTRDRMAVFLLKAKHGPAYAPPAATGTFADVPVTNLYAPWIEQLAREGITGGCGKTTYCPDDPATRAQMAVFLLRAKHGAGYGPPPATGMFADVPMANPYAPWIEQLAREGITGGCGPTTYCPDDPVTRGQMAVFLVRTFNLPM